MRDGLEDLLDDEDFADEDLDEEDTLDEVAEV
jgi:hypothetical protein